MISLNYLAALPGAFFLLLVINRFLPIPKLWRQIVLFVAMTFAVNPVIWLGDLANILIVAAVMFAAIPLLCGGRMAARFSVCLLLFSVAISSSAILTNLRPPLDGYPWAFAGALWFCIYLFVRRFVRPEAVQTIQPKRWLLLDALAFLPFGVTLVIVVFAQPTRTYVSTDAHNDVLVIGNEQVLLILLALAAVYSVGLLLYVALLARQERLEQQEMLWTIRRQHYANLEQNQLQVRRLRHDMANHLNAMAGMEDAAMREYLAQLAATPAMTGGRRFCENDLVNAVLSGKQPLIEAEGIEAEYQLALPQKLPLSDVDLCAIFANCLDNAIEACQKCPPNARHIHLSARAEKGLLALRMENSMAGALKTDGNKLATSKADAKNHGLGMAEIQDIVQQQGGVLRYGQEADTFQMQLSMPLDGGPHP